MTPEQNNRTICAIATAQGQGAIAVLRLSGSEAFRICEKIFIPMKEGKKLLLQKPNTIHFGQIVSNGEIIDEVLVSLFKAPNSYTGEDVVEISCHGSRFIQQKILQLLIQNGASHAQAGEFTMRAFLNGKMDLSQAEAVADLIASETDAARRVAMRQMRGGFADELKGLRDEMVRFVSLMELELDFSEEDVEFADRNAFLILISKIEKVIARLTESFSFGNVLKNGVPVAIVGEPNVGKSTLLNVLLNEERAIVSEIAGTTRDVIEDVIIIDGFAFRFIDTAGIRHTHDIVETLGIERTFDKIKNAAVVLLLVDARTDMEVMDKKIDELKEKISNNQKLVLVVNKTDLTENLFCAFNNFEEKTDAIVFLSAKYKQNIDGLIDVLLTTVHNNNFHQNEVIVTNTRHYEALIQTLNSIQNIKHGFQNQLATDLLTIDIRECLHHLGSITGEITTDEILGNIFSKFCIGK